MGKKKHHEGHGGAWKVAYADLATALMALFMVLWISAQQKEILIATSKYFQNPFSSPMPSSSGVMDGKRERVDSDQNASVTRIFTAEAYLAMAKEFLRMLDLNDPAKKEKPIEIKAVGDGILITVFNRDKQTIFKPGTTEMTPWGEYAAQNLSWIIDRFHLKVRVDAHTPTGALPLDENIDSWDLTSEQANVFRKKLIHYGLDTGRFDRISGMADSRPQEGSAGTDTSNYRIELTLTATPQTPNSLRKEITK